MTRSLDENWDMEFGGGLGSFCFNQASTVQSVKARLQTFLGEWFLDTSAGCFSIDPDSDVSLGAKPVNLPYQEAIAKQTILQTDGVDTIASFSLTYDPSSRSVTIDATINTIYGTTENVVVRSGS